MTRKLILFIFITGYIFSQTAPSAFQSYTKEYRTENGISHVRTLINGLSPVIYQSSKTPGISQTNTMSGSMMRWLFQDPYSIGDVDQTSGDGLYQAVGWGLNTERISLYGNTNNTPLWEFSSNTNTNINYTAVSENSNFIANGSYHNIYIFDRTSSTPVFNYDLETQLVDTGTAGPLDITSNGGFIVACASRNDSSWIMGFQRTSTTPVWRYRVGQTNGSGGAGIYGIRMSGNDSLVIVNTYLGVYVFRTYTGQLMYSGTVNPINNNGTQSPQGISGNGSIIATINFIGYVRILQWNGSTYNLLWQHQEPPGTYYNWMASVDISYDGSMVACGTLNFVTSSTQDGKIKFFRTSAGSAPVWTYTGTGGSVPCVSFSKGGNILSAVSWGDLNHTTNDLYVFKTSAGINVPIFQLNTPGSLFWCSTSNDGTTVLASGKAVHAYQFGYGGLAYNILIDTNDTPLGIPGSSNIPNIFSLEQNFPNPFNPSTDISYNIAKTTRVQLIVYNAAGKEIQTLVNRSQSNGKYSVKFNAESLSSGVYFYTLKTDDFTQTRKMVLIK